MHRLVPTGLDCAKPLQFQIGRKDIHREVIASLATRASPKRSLNDCRRLIRGVVTSGTEYNFVILCGEMLYKGRFVRKAR